MCQYNAFWISITQTYTQKLIMITWKNLHIEWCHDNNIVFIIKKYTIEARSTHQAHREDTNIYNRKSYSDLIIVLQSMAPIASYNRRVAFFSVFWKLSYVDCFQFINGVFYYPHHFWIRSTTCIPFFRNQICLTVTTLALRCSPFFSPTIENLQWSWKWVWDIFRNGPMSKWVVIAHSLNLLAHST